MLLGCLGIIRKLLELWSTSAKFVSRQDVSRIFTRLANINNQVTREFQRVTRSLGDLGKWKAVEFRFFFIIRRPVCAKWYFA